MPESTVEAMVHLKIDGQAVSVPKGTTVLQACEKAGSPVPFYCYHPGLTIAGNCRICLVEVEGAPKLQISCHTQVSEGMVVHTKTPKAVEGRRDVLEFLLSNHPLDCPVCDQAGECWLQDYYMRHGLYNPRFDEPKTKKPKAVPVGPKIMLDAERCILCSRCVRFTDEISETSELGIFNRGDHAEIGVHEGKVLENPYAGNVVDICPVGALTDRDFRFKCRVWYLAEAKSVCTGCSKGCNTLIHYNREREWRPHIAGGDRVMRLKPRFNDEVNRWWMCDEGRYGYKFIDKNRIEHVLIRESENEQLEGEWPEALALLAEKLKKTDPASVGAVFSSYMTNEELYAARRIFSELGIENLVFQRPPQGPSDDLLRQADKSPNAAGARALGITEGAEPLLQKAAKGEIQVLVLFLQDLAQVVDASLVERALAKCRFSVFIGSNHNATSARTDLVLPSAVYAEKEGTFTNVDRRVQRIREAFSPWAEARTELSILGLLAENCALAWKPSTARRVFEELSLSVPAFDGLSYAQLGDEGVPLKP